MPQRQVWSFARYSREDIIFTYLIFPLDVLCIQETKLTETSFNERKDSDWYKFLNGNFYKEFHAPNLGSVESLSGCWGVATFVKNTHAEDVEILYICRSGRLLITQHDNHLVLLNVYAPAGTSVAKQRKKYDERFTVLIVLAARDYPIFVV